MLRSRTKEREEGGREHFKVMIQFTDISIFQNIVPRTKSMTGATENTKIMVHH